LWLEMILFVKQLKLLHDYSPSYLRSVTLSNEIELVEDLREDLFSSDVGSCLKESCCVLTRRQPLVGLLLAPKKSTPSNSDRSEVEQSKWVAPLLQLSSKSGFSLLW
jgi:hypothetical protein